MSGASIPGASITVTNQQTSKQDTVVTTSRAATRRLPLSPGEYRVDAGLQGFRRAARTVTVQINSTVVIDFTLEVGDLTDEVEVRADATLLETSSGTVGKLVDNRRILELPLNTRNVYSLISRRRRARAAPAPGVRAAGTRRGDPRLRGAVGRRGQHRPRRRLRMGCGQKVPGWTVMRNCASGMQSIDSAINNIRAGRSNLVLAGGVDALSRAPLLFSDAMVDVAVAMVRREDVGPARGAAREVQAAAISRR